MNLPHVRRPLVVILAYVFGISVGLAHAASALPSAPGAAVVTIAPPGGNYTEPSIAVNPNDPRQVLAVYQGGKTAQGSATAAYSADGGKTFTVAAGTKASDWKVMGDVSTAFDNKGHAFLCYLAFDKLGTPSYWAHNAGRNGIFVIGSGDGGKTWDRNAVSVKSWPTGREPNLQFEDEPRIFADGHGESPFAGHLYVGWVEWQLEKSIMLFSRSSDGGKTWSEPTEISVHAGLPRDDNGALGGFMQAIGSDGKIYAVWQDGNSILLTTSSDGGRSFTAPRNIVETGPPYFGEVPGTSRAGSFPQIAVHGHELYLSWSDYTNGDIDVFLSRSADSGETWSKPARVNDDPVHDGLDQFFQWLAVDEANGDLYVQFYDRRNDPTNKLTGMTLARSTDGGHSFKNYSWTEDAFEGHGMFWGDYTWLAASNGIVHGVWTAVVAPPKSRPQRQAKASTVIRAGTADFSSLTARVP
ncbi:MAG: exo-alpha-sialidase [Acidobacteriaceae bacterium]|nr:exo-alpha-sialidase [Acidobacteriaceae bacterium]